MDIVSLLIQLVSGALGGNVAGSLLKNLSLGTVGNTLSGGIGGLLGGQILSSMLHLPTATVGGAIDPTAIIGQLASGGVGGGGLMAIIGLIRSMMNK